MRLVVFAIFAIAIYLGVKEYNQSQETGPSYANTYSEETLSAISKGKMDLLSIRSGISRDFKRSAFRGDSIYQDTLSDSKTRLFANVLITPILASASLGWKKTGERSYQYTYGIEAGEYAEFQYYSDTGEILCLSDISICMLFE